MNILNYIIKHWILSSALSILFLGAGFYMITRNPDVAYNTVVAGRGNIRQEVSVTGKIKPVSAVDLAFEKTGKISRIYADIGDKVSSGKILAELDRSDLLAQLSEARANLTAQSVKLDELKNGTRPEEIQVQEVKVSNAEISLADARQYLMDKIKESYTKADDAIRNTADQFFNSPRSSSPQLSFSGVDGILKSKLENGRANLETLLINWNENLKNIALSSDLNSNSAEANYNLNQVKEFIDDAALAVNSLTPNSNLTQATIDSWKSGVSTARTSVNAGLANLSAASEKVRAAQSALDLEKNQLALKKAGSTPEAISAQEAQVSQAAAKVENIQTQIEKTILRSPIAGTIVRQDAKIGEIVSGNANIISVISENDLKIEANIPEVDIGKINIGNNAVIALDAFSGENFSGKISYIDPGETIIEGVTTYKITMYFGKEDARIRSGMTADIDILTAEKNNVIIIPQRAVVSRNGDRFVSLLVNGEVREVAVETGIRSFEGMVEISEGLIGGEEVIVSEK